MLKIQLAFSPHALGPEILCTVARLFVALDVSAILHQTEGALGRVTLAHRSITRAA